MLAENLISDVVPALRLTDTGQQALNWMDVFRVSHLPVVKEKEYLGLISDKFIYDLNLLDSPIEKQMMQLHTPHVHKSQHVFEVASIMYKLKLSVVPVVDDEHTYLGVITLYELARKFAQLFSLQEPGGVIILEVSMHNYSLSQIGQIAEGNDMRILSLFVNKIQDSDNLNVTLKLDKLDLSPIIQTFMRYDYNISAVYTDDSMLGDLYQDRMDQFLRYMDI